MVVYERKAVSREYSLNTAGIIMPQSYWEEMEADQKPLAPVISTLLSMASKMGLHFREESS